MRLCVSALALLGMNEVKNEIQSGREKRGIGEVVPQNRCVQRTRYRALRSGLAFLCRAPARTPRPDRRRFDCRALQPNNRPTLSPVISNYRRLNHKSSNHSPSLLTCLPARRASSSVNARSSSVCALSNCRTTVERLSAWSSETLVAVSMPFETNCFRKQE